MPKKPAYFPECATCETETTTYTFIYNGEIHDGTYKSILEDMKACKVQSRGDIWTKFVDPKNIPPHSDRKSLKEEFEKFLDYAKNSGYIVKGQPAYRLTLKGKAYFSGNGKLKHNSILPGDFFLLMKSLEEEDELSFFDLLWYTRIESKSTQIPHFVSLVNNIVSKGLVQELYPTEKE